MHSSAAHGGRSLLAAVLTVAGLAAPPASPALGQDSPLARYGIEEIGRRQAAGQMVDRENISRYFAAYPLPTEQGEAERLLRTAQRILRGFAGRLYRAAADAAREQGQTEIAAAHVERLAAELLPRAPTPFNSVVFFPRAAPEERIEVETIDLEAFLDTPFPWSALVVLAAGEELATLPSMRREAAPAFARAVSDYGLLVFRLGGEIARRELAQELASPQLREAEKALDRRIGGGRPPAAATETATAAAAGTPFADVTAAAGIRFRHVSSDWISRFRRYGTFAPSFSGGGVSAGDLDGDEWPDLVFCGGEGCAVFRNRGDGGFEDVTAATGLGVRGEARMALLADLDNDGDADVFLTYARDTNRLFENLGGWKFRDRTAAAGLERRGEMGGPAVAFDFDNDGLLDLYVGNFGDYLAGETPWQAVDNQNAQPNRLFRNRGGLVFEDVTERSGTGNTGWAQAISHLDYNLDGHQDLYIANDFGRNELLENLGDGTFARRGGETGTDDEFHGMNVAFTDFNRDGYPDILITNIWGWLFTEPEPGEYNKLFVSRPDGDGGVGYRVDGERIPELFTRDTGWSWGALFFDADNDADDDLFLLNGHTDYSTFLQYRPHPTRPGAIYPINNGREANLFFRNEGGVLRVPAAPSGAELAELNSRAVALLDFDRDGDLDLALSTFHSEARLFRNDLPPPANRWLTVELEGDPGKGVNRDAIGARVIARGAGGLYVWRSVDGGHGYLAMSTLPVAMGLGAAEAVDLEITWPGGERQELRGIPPGRSIRVRQGVESYETIEPPGTGGAAPGAGR